MKKEELFAVAIPAQTKTYVPISHQSLTETVAEKLDKAGLMIKDERFSQNRSGQQMFGNFIVGAGDAEMDMNIGFRNSYDKSMQVGIVAGSRVIVCSNLMFKGDFKKMAMHYGNVAQELDAMVQEAVDGLEKQFKLIKKDAKKLKMVKVDDSMIAHVLGELFYYQDILTTTQLKLIKEEIHLQTNFGKETMWDIYNHTTEVLKKSPVSSIVSDHILTHEFYMERV